MIPVAYLYAPCVLYSQVVLTSSSHIHWISQSLTLSWLCTIVHCEGSTCLIFLTRFFFNQSRSKNALEVTLSCLTAAGDKTERKTRFTAESYRVALVTALLKQKVFLLRKRIQFILSFFHVPFIPRCQKVNLSYTDSLIWEAEKGSAKCEIFHPHLLSPVLHRWPYEITEHTWNALLKVASAFISRENSCGIELSCSCTKLGPYRAPLEAPTSTTRQTDKQLGISRQTSSGEVSRLQRQPAHGAVSTDWSHQWVKAAVWKTDAPAAFAVTGDYVTTELLFSFLSVFRS